MADYYTITTSLPDHALSPNARAHWTGKHRAKKNAMIAAEMLTRQAMGRHGAPLWRRASIRAVAFLRKGRAKPDPDNFIASLKPIIDGIEKAGLIQNDRDVVYEPPMFLDQVNGEELKLIVKEIP